MMSDTMLLFSTTRIRSRVTLAGVVAIVILSGCARVATSTATPSPETARAQRAPALPDRLSDADYWKLLSDISEPGGYFRIEDNYTSNEMEIGQLYSMIRTAGIKGGVYMGVGPEQNFTYIAAIRPKMAFIVDIRRQAVMQHLMFKAMFEMAKDRADFISTLFGKPRPGGLDTATSIQDLWTAYRAAPSDSVRARENYRRIVDLLTKTHGFTFTPSESEQLKAVFDAFYYYGPSIATRGFASGRGGDFADLTGYSKDESGQTQSFLSSEDNYRYLKSLHDRNLIVPVSGDFAGPKAIRAIGTYVREHNGIVSAFYVSNVEQYLFGDMKADAFYANVATLPVDSMSVFIRPYSMRRMIGGTGSTQSLCPIARFLRAAEAGRVLGNNEALACLP
jgi:hypothetical protein